MAIRVQGMRMPDSERYGQGDALTVDVQGVLTVWGLARERDEDREVVAIWAAGTWERAHRE
ncbi:MAG TPA: hypothetical protein VGL20_06300 [Candidatus Dormibacteraeota bacterium]|jgi:hypothetical protein